MFVFKSCTAKSTLGHKEKLFALIRCMVVYQFQYYFLPLFIRLGGKAKDTKKFQLIVNALWSLFSVRKKMQGHREMQRKGEPQRW